MQHPIRHLCTAGDSLGLDSSLGPSLGLTKGGLAPKTRVPSVKCQPPLTEGEAGFFSPTKMLLGWMVCWEWRMVGIGMDWTLPLPTSSLEKSYAVSL